MKTSVDVKALLRSVGEAWDLPMYVPTTKNSLRKIS